MPLRFDFGRNWEAFSAAKIDSQRLADAADSLRQLIGTETIEGRTFLDIGCGSGLFSVAAAMCGAARVVGFDSNRKSVNVSKQNLMRLGAELQGKAMPEFLLGDVLDDSFLVSLPKFDVVYAWGVLHHTGAMWEAMRKAAALVEPRNGTLVLAIYHHHWTSPIWRQVKRLYNLSPGPVRWLMNYVFGALIYVAVWVTTRANPLDKKRGMDFWFDVIDWLGGYPYEYARVHEVVGAVEPLGFKVEHTTRPRGHTGCNEFVFRRAAVSGDEDRAACTREAACASHT